MVRIVASVERGGSCAPKRGPIERAATVGFAKLGVFSEQAEADEKVGLAAAHGLLQVKDGLRGCPGEASDAFANEVLHALRDLGLLEELGAIAFGGDQLVELLDLVAELDRKRVGLEFASISDGFQICSPRKYQGTAVLRRRRGQRAEGAEGVDRRGHAGSLQLLRVDDYCG